MLKTFHIFIFVMKLIFYALLFQRIVAQNAASVGVMSEDDVE